jgi:hypothetical protein
MLSTELERLRFEGERLVDENESMKKKYLEITDDNQTLRSSIREAAQQHQRDIDDLKTRISSSSQVSIVRK